MLRLHTQFSVPQSWVLGNLKREIGNKQWAKLPGLYNFQGAGKRVSLRVPERSQGRLKETRCITWANQWCKAQFSFAFQSEKPFYLFGLGCSEQTKYIWGWVGNLENTYISVLVELDSQRIPSLFSFILRLDTFQKGGGPSLPKSHSATYNRSFLYVLRLKS